MQIVILLFALLGFNIAPAYAGCEKEEVCSMMGTMGHFDILNQCPNAGPMLAECKKVNEATLEELQPPNFVDNGDGTIADTVNKLLWAKTGLREDGTLVRATYKDAKKLAFKSNIGGKFGWRLPTLVELKTLMHEERIINASGKKAWINPLFDDGTGHYYWTSTSCADISVIEDRYQKKICQQGEQAVWLVHFNINAVFWHHITADNYHIWMVQELK